MPEQLPAPPRDLTRGPTPFEGLNAVLAHFLTEVREALGDNFVGAYLQGSFAVGDGDEHSDCDFIVAIERDVSPAEALRLDTVHKAIHDLPCEPWRHRLDGSYAPVGVLRRLTAEPRDPPGQPRGPDWTDPGLGGAPARWYPFVYLDHGFQRTVRSAHDNTQVVRWSLREKGVVLAGPDPRTLIDPVTPAMLREEVLETMALVASLNLEPMSMRAWQAFWVGLHCRMLHTLATGRVWSKMAGTAWALEHLDRRWAPLIETAQAIKEGSREVAMAPPDPADVEATRAFARYALEKATQEARARDLIAQKLESKRSGGHGGKSGWDGTLRADGKSRSTYAPPPYRSHDRGKRG